MVSGHPGMAHSRAVARSRASMADMSVGVGSSNMQGWQASSPPRTWEIRQSAERPRHLLRRRAEEMCANSPLARRPAGSRPRGRFGTVRPMSDPDDEDREPDRVGPKIAAGLAVAGAVIRLGPEAALALGAASPLFESMAERAWGELRPDARRRTAQVLSTAAEEAGCDDEKLSKLVGASETSRLQTGLAMAAAERTAWPPKVRALGRVLAAGLIASDEAEVDVQQQALASMTDLDRLHVILLELLARHEPDWTHDGLRVVLHRMPSYQNIYLGGDRPDNPKMWTIGRRKWTVAQICAARPQLRPVLTTLLGTLQRHGLAAQNDTAPEVLKQLGENLMQQVNRQAGQMQRGKQMKPITLERPTIRDVEPSWSPTELGEKVLDYYRLAGEEVPDE